MKAKSGDKIQITKDVCYGSVYGLISIDKGTILTVSERNNSDDGIETEETITLRSVIGQKAVSYNIWDNDYIVLNN